MSSAVGVTLGRMSIAARSSPDFPADSSHRMAWCDVCAADRIFVEPDLVADDDLAELELAAPGWACSNCGAGTWLDAVIVATVLAA